MSEISSAHLKHQIKQAGKGLEKFLHDLNDVKKEAARELGGIQNQVRPIIEQKEHPRILQLNVGEDEYVSIRRTEGGRLKTRFDLEIPGDIESTRMTVFIPTSLLPDDGMIGVLGISQTFNAEPKDKEDIEFINEITKDEDLGDSWVYITRLQWFLAEGREYKKENWDLSKCYSDVRTLKRDGGRFYLLMDGLVEEIKPNADGNLEIPHWGYYWSEAELEVQKDLNERFGIFYTMVKGSSQKEEKRQEEPGRQNIPAAVTIKS